MSGKVIRQPLYAAQVAPKRVKAYASYYAGKGKSSLPEAVTLFLTHRCNLRCRMCGQWGEQGVTKQKAGDTVTGDMTGEELKTVIDDLASFRPNITLFGGEPLLHRHSVDLIRHVKNRGMHCLMITNGSLVIKVADELVESGLDELNVSIDGAGELHDEIRGMPGLFDRIVTGLKNITELKKEKKIKKPLINVQCTINRDNCHHLEQMLDVVKEIRADSLTFHNLIFVSKDMMRQQHEFDTQLRCSSAGWEGFVFEPFIDPDLLYSKMNNILNARKGFTVDFYPNFPLTELREYYNNPSYQPGKGAARCVSPWMTAYLFPNGELRPCLNFDYSFGNVKAHSFARLWNSESALTFRKTLRENRTFPACVRCTELFRY